MARTRKRIWTLRLLLVAASVVFTFLLLLMAEGALRLFTDQTVLGHSERLFVPNAFGETTGNAKGVAALSYGDMAYTDTNGFRVPEALQGKPASDPDGRPEVIILGDSVGFGTGVPDEQTMSGQLREAVPSLHVINTSVVGYTAEDYKNVVEHFVAKRENVEHVFVAFCLNDVTQITAANIRAHLAKKQQTEGTAEKKEPQKPGTSLKKFAPLAYINGQLRAHSVLYIWLKNQILTPESRARYYTDMYRLAQDSVLEELEPLKQAAEQLRTRNVKFTVIILPFRQQISDDSEESLNPQNILKAYFTEHGIDHIDARTAFEPEEATSYFLLGDVIHLSVRGHKVMADVMSAHLSR